MKRCEQWRLDEAVSRYQNGMTSKQAVQGLGISSTTCIAELKRRGLPVRSVSDGWSSNDVREAMIRDYLAGMTADEVARTYGYSKQTLKVVLRKRGLEREKTTKRDNAIQRNRIIELYQSGMVLDDIIKETGHCKQTCKRVLLGAGVPIRRSRYERNEDYFETIDTSEKAYWIGFLMADGCVHNGVLSVRLQSGDWQHLRMLADAMCSNKPVTTERRRTGKNPDGSYCTLAIGSQKMASDLISHGIVERKTYCAEPWKGPDDLMPHFWRGMIDGDGTISKTGKLWTIGLCGTRDIVDGFAEFVHKTTGSNAKSRQGIGIWHYRIHGISMPQRLAHALYGIGGPSLERKRKLYEELIQGPSCCIRTPDLKERIERALSDGPMETQQLANAVGTTRGNLKQWLGRLKEEGFVVNPLLGVWCLPSPNAPLHPRDSIRMLLAESALTRNEIAERLGFEKQRTSDVLQRMAKKGIVAMDGNRWRLNQDMDCFQPSDS